MAGWKEGGGKVELGSGKGVDAKGVGTVISG